MEDVIHVFLQKSTFGRRVTEYHQTHKNMMTGNLYRSTSASRKVLGSSVSEEREQRREEKREREGERERRKHNKRTH